jgi:hypothetical protein
VISQHYTAVLKDMHRMRRVSVGVLTAMLTPPLAAYAQEFEDARFCQAIQEIAVKERGSKLNDHTARVAVAALCETKFVGFKIRLGVPIGDLRADWQAHNHTLWNQMHCQGPMRAAIDNGWIIALTITSIDGQGHYMTAECR